MSKIGEPPRDDVKVTLKRAHALILFEFLSRYANEGELAIKDQAEQRVLWDLCCDLERVLDEPLRPDYNALLIIARDSVRDPEEWQRNTSD
jgi:hypothetical protein